MPFCQELTSQYGVDVHRPIVCQVSRFDPWKDPVGVIEAFRIVRERVPDAQLVLAGSMATDDPEGFRVWDETEAARAGDRDIYLLSNLHQVGSVQINAFQRIADVVLQKSLREGFGLTVSEGLWKGRPGDRRACRRDQAPDPRRSSTATSSTRSRSARQRTIDLLADPVGADALGAQGNEHVREQLPLDARARGLADPVRGAARMMLVTHRGPYRFSVHDDGIVRVDAWSGRHRQRAAAARAAANDTGERQAWVAAAIDDDDRRRDRGRCGRGARARPPPARPRSRSAPPALRRDLERDAVVPASRAVRPRPPAPLRPSPARRVGRLRRGERRVRRGRHRRRHGRRAGAGARLPARPGARHGAGGPPRPAAHALHPHALLRPQLDPGAADRHGRGAVRLDGCRCRAGSTPSGGHAPTRHRRREVLGTSPRWRRTRRRSGPDPDALAALAASPAAGARRRRARRAGRRPQAGAAQRPHRPVEEHRARVPRVRRAPRAPTPNGATASCSSPCSTGPARTWPSTSPTSRRSTRPRRG